MNDAGADEEICAVRRRLVRGERHDSVSWALRTAKRLGLGTLFPNLGRPPERDDKPFVDK